MDVVELTKVLSHQVDHVTCIECCKLYVGPKTALCGHSLCHYCWSGRQTCPVCQKPVHRKDLTTNRPLESRTTYISNLRKTFECLFNINFDEFQHEVLIEKHFNKETSIVKEWLENSQNRFSAFSQQSVLSMSQSKPTTSKALVHDSNGKKSTPGSPHKITRTIAQDDWDKIEILPSTEVVEKLKDKENVIGPMDLEPFSVDSEYTEINPRRSSRKRGIKNNNSNKQNQKRKIENKVEIDKKAKQNWNNVMKMKKEFSKLNKLNKNKLDVSIEESTKAQSMSKKDVFNMNTENDDIINDNETDINSKVVKPVIDTNKNELIESEMKNIKPRKSLPSVINYKEHVDKCPLKINVSEDNAKTFNNLCTNKETDTLCKNKIPFILKSSLCPKYKPSADSHIVCHTSGSFSNVSYINISKNPKNEITIHIGKSIMDHINIDNQLKVKKDCQVQTTLGEYSIQNIVNKHDKLQNITTDAEKLSNIVCEIEQVKSSSKKHTADADTATVEGEMTLTDSNKTHPSIVKSIQEVVSPREKPLENTAVKENEEIIIDNDLDIFDSDPFKEPPVHLLRNTRDVVSKIIPTKYKNQNIRQKVCSDKRSRDESDGEVIHCSKKAKTMSNVESLKETFIHNSLKSHAFDNDMSNLFSNNEVEKMTQNKELNDSISEKGNKTKPDNSENIFTVLEKEKDSAATQQNINLASQCSSMVIFKTANTNDLPSTNVPEAPENNMDIELCTPVLEQFDSDHSVVEDTPQKNSSFSKIKAKNDTTIKSITSVRKSKESRKDENNLQRKQSAVKHTEIINVSDSSQSVHTGKHSNKRMTAETPVDISNFVNQIKHNSTPMARKHLNFSAASKMDDLEETLCPTSSQIVKTTQEKEFLREAFEDSLETVKYYVASSCLSNVQTQKLIALCCKMGWTYIQKFTNELTHLVVSVDEENKAQRSLKYICALSAGKWIVSFNWVDNCIQKNKVCPEDEYEVLDTCGAPSPKLSRMAQKSQIKLFADATFYCMPPFSILDKSSLELILQLSGGRVVDEMSKVRASGPRPHIVLAEPESSQEDKFMYLAIELGIVPVSFEWVLNSLSEYKLFSIYNYLLCPAELLKRKMSLWPDNYTAEDITVS